ncbi:MAG TPA: TolC family protein [Gemmatimonadaceae bacterium]|jgi:outer membrane protein TolC|nr:TolC family protein [Gemmatimonadaceae bacterium]
MTTLLSRLIAFALALTVVSGRASAQLTLAEALRTADRAAYANRMAGANAAAADAQRLAPLRGVLPAVRLEGGYLRTTDPIGAFGTRLKQREIGESDFAPSRLNFPNAIGNYTAGVVAEQPLLNADSWLARRATARGASASESSAEWTRLSTRADVIRAYYGAVLAAERVTTLDAAAKAAQAHVRQAESMVRAGMATKSDALLAAVKAGEVEAQRIEARSDAEIARRQLALVIGSSANVDPTLPATLPSSRSIRQVTEGDTLDAASGARADVDAARLGVDAARANVQRARSLYLPRLNAFARYDWNSPQQLYRGERSWTVGILASWSPFEGGAQLAETQAAAAKLELATAAADAAIDQARLETQRSLASLRSALARLDIAERAVAQSAEAHRIVGRKYDGGLATVVELLDAAAAETATALALSNAKFAAVGAAADRRRALGRDPGSLAVLDSASNVAGAIH